MMTKQRYHLRLTARFAFYDEVKSHMLHEWPAGAIVTDPKEIETLTARGAPVEKIEIQPATPVNQSHK